MADIKEAIRRLIYQYTVEGADKVMATQEAVAASTTKTDKASLSLEKSFGSLERKYVDTVRAQQDYAKVQDKVNAAVAQNPELQERANKVLAAAGQHFDNIASGATKGSMATTVLARTLMRTIGPLALVGAAVAAISSAMEFMEPIAVRVGADIYNRFSQAFPAAAKFAESVYNAGKAFVEFENARAKAEAIDAALRGVASSAQLAALNTKLLNQELVNQRGLAEAAQAAERMADHIMRLREIYPGVTQEVAKQLELMDAQLAVAQARTQEEKLIAEEKLRQVQLTQQGISGDEQQLIIARERAIAEADAAKAREKNVYYSESQTAATNEAYAAQSRVTGEVEDTTRAVNHTTIAVYNTAAAVEDLGVAMYGVSRYALYMANSMSLAENVARGMLGELPFKPEGYTVGGTGIYQVPAAQKSNIVQQAIEARQAMLEGTTAAGTEGLSDPTAAKFMQDQRDAFNAQTNATKDLTGSTDALNATMQNILSPYYSQDPRTTKLGFRAGSVGNADWMVAGASNENPLAAVLGYGATAPGMANGGSFVVGGGYSANDNKIAAFPVASGEQVVVNRNRAGGGAGNVVNIDNRIIITGTVDADAMSQLKVSRYQQAQRMRAGLAQA